jgi:hypothetical protein
VRDADDLALERAVALTVRAVSDAAPKVQLAADGIGQLVTPEAVLPFEVKASDDYGLTGGRLRFKTGGPQHPAEEGSRNLGLPELKREIDLPFPVEVANLRKGGVPAGTFLTFSAEVQDNDPLGSKATPSASIALRVVTPEELLQDLIRRQHELRRELMRTRDEEDKLAQGLENLDAKVQERAPKAQQAIHKVVTDTARAMTLVVDEMRHNKLLDERARARIVDEVIARLEALRDGELLKARALAEATLAAKGEGPRVEKSKEAGASARVVVAELDTIIARMKRVADLAELVAKLREFIKKQRDILEETRPKR